MLIDDAQALLGRGPLDIYIETFSHGRYKEPPRDVKLSCLTPESQSCLEQDRFVLVSYEDRGAMM